MSISVCLRAFTTAASAAVIALAQINRKAREPAESAMGTINGGIWVRVSETTGLFFPPTGAIG